MKFLNRHPIMGLVLIWACVIAASCLDSYPLE